MKNGIYFHKIKFFAKMNELVIIYNDQSNNMRDLCSRYEYFLLAQIPGALRQFLIKNF